MQNVLIEKPYQFVPRIKATWPQTLYCKFGMFKRPLRKLQGVEDFEIRNVDLLRRSLSAGHGIMITPNHPRMADPMAVCYLAQQTPCNFYAMASWHLFNQGWLTRTTIRLMGAFSVNREGLDRQAVDHAIEILQTAERPLVIFPEGTTSRTNDQLMSLMEGPAFIARTAAKRRAKHVGGKVVVHPVGIKYVFQGDVHAAGDDVLTQIEEKPALETVPRHAADRPSHQSGKWVADSPRNCNTELTSTTGRIASDKPQWSIGYWALWKKNGSATNSQKKELRYESRTCE